MIGIFKKSSFAKPAWSIASVFLVISLTVLLPLTILFWVVGLVRFGILPGNIADILIGNSTLAAIVRTSLSFAIELGLLLWVKKHYRLKLADFGLRKFNFWRAIGVILTLFVVFIGLVFVAYLLISVLWPQVDLNEAQKSGFEFGRHGIGLAGSFVVTVLVAPIIEEVYFRGFVLPAFAAKWGNLVGIILSSALFGILHMQINVGVYTFILGVLLSLMYIRFRSIGPGIMFHIINNLIVFFILLKA